MSYLRHILSTTVVVAGLSLLQPAHAVPQLQLSLSDGTTTVVLVDTLQTGLLIHTGAIGNWFVNVTTGTGYPVTGTLNIPLIDLNSINVSSTAGGSLTMMLTEINLVDTEAGSTFTAGIGGTISTNPGTSLAYSAYSDSTNTAFGTQSQIGAATFGSGPFSYGNSAWGQTGSLYSMTQIVVLTASAGSLNTNISFNGELTKVPEPASLALIGAALVGLGLARRRKQA